MNKLLNDAEEVMAQVAETGIPCVLTYIDHIPSAFGPSIPITRQISYSVSVETTQDILNHSHGTVCGLPLNRIIVSLERRPTYDSTSILRDFLISQLHNRGHETDVSVVFRKFE